MKSTKSFFAALVSLLLMILVPQLARANVLVNGDFENEPNYGSGVLNYSNSSALTGSQIPGWTIEPSHAVTIHKNVGGVPVISGTYSANIDGEGYNGLNANFYQDFASTSGQSYDLQYDWYGWSSTATHLDVTITDTITSSVLYHGFISFAASPPTYHVSAHFTGTGNPLRLRIQENVPTGSNDNGFVVDNFTVDPVGSSAIPTLNKWMLAILACLLLGAGVIMNLRCQRQ